LKVHADKNHIKRDLLGILVAFIMKTSKTKQINQSFKDIEKSGHAYLI